MLLAHQIHDFNHLQKAHRLSAVDVSSSAPTFEEFISTTPFHYKPLMLGQPSIRLVRILPELSKDGLIQCNILHATSTASYVCLSYMWDYNPAWDNDADARTERVVLIDGRRLFVRRNLFDFLCMAQHLMVTRRSEASLFRRSSLFWIDAICINQSDPLERNHQVAQMGEIYSRASSVHVWLGKALPRLLDIVTSTDEVTGHDEHKTVLQKVLHDRHQPGGSYTPVYRHVGPRCETVDDRHIGLDCQKVRFDEDHSVYDLVKTIYSNPYWRRAWIAQELELARELTFWLSASAVSLSFLRDIADEIDGGLMKQETAHFYDMVNSSRRSVRRDLVIWLAQHATKECADPRDRIYSLLSLRLENSRKIPVDYSIPIARFAYYAMRGSEFLCLCSAAIVAKALGIIGNEPHSELPRNLAGPWVEVDMSGYFMEPEDRVIPESVFVDNICGCFERRELKFTLSTDVVPHDDSSITVRHLEKRWYTVRMALWMVLDLAPPSPGLCKRALGGARHKPVARVGWM